MKIFKFLPLTLIFFHLFISNSLLYANKNNTTDVKPSILILPADASQDNLYDGLQKELLAVLASALTQLDRHKIIDRNALDIILQEQALQLTGILSESVLYEIGNLASANKAITLNILHFTQKEVPLEKKNKDNDDNDDLSFGQQLALALVKGATKTEETKKDFSHNIQTSISAELKLLDMENGQTLHSFTIRSGHTGGSAGKSRSMAVNKAKYSMLRELKKTFLLETKVELRERKGLLLSPGSIQGVKKGMIFELSSPDQLLDINGKSLSVPGYRRAFIYSTEVSENVFRAKVLRQFSQPEKGDTGFELIEHPLAYQYTFEKSETSMALGFDMVFNSLFPTHTSFGLHLKQLKDNDDNTILGGVLKTNISSTLIKILALQLRGGLNTELYLSGREDDENHFVSAVGLGISPELSLNLKIKEEIDGLVTVGYRVFFLSPWKYSVTDDEENVDMIPADWNDNRDPDIENNGIYLSLSLRKYLFK